MHGQVGMLGWKAGLQVFGKRSACCLSSIDMQHTRSLLQAKEAFIIDCDGVLYHGEHVLPGAKDFVDYLRKHKKKFLFLTNASDRTAKELSEKFNRLGLGGELSPNGPRLVQHVDMPVGMDSDKEFVN